MSGAATVNAVGIRISMPACRTVTSTWPGSSTGTTTESTSRSPDSDVSTGTPGTCCPPTLTLTSRSSSAWSTYVSASSIPIASPGRASPSPPVSTPAIR
ncbi:hypothetical protein [Streptomyces regalis]|uniref:hypothetical protein n=1 Tax=Streptomyces regalis TaxID=68262 RepID=UPI00131CC330|nr:hypothetical protein [Streptomyces regalis]